MPDKKTLEEYLSDNYGIDIARIAAKNTYTQKDVCLKGMIIGDAYEIAMRRLWDCYSQKDKLAFEHVKDEIIYAIKTDLRYDMIDEAKKILYRYGGPASQYPSQYYTGTYGMGKNSYYLAELLYYLDHQPQAFVVTIMRPWLSGVERFVKKKRSEASKELKSIAGYI